MLLLVLFVVPFLLASFNENVGLLSKSSSSGLIGAAHRSVPMFVDAQGRRRRRRLGGRQTRRQKYDEDDEEEEEQQQQQQQDGDNEQNGDASSDNKFFMEKHSFKPPFLFGGQQSIPYWEYGGSSIATENYVRIVPNIKSRTGYIWNTEPVNMKKWQVDFDIHIHNTHNPGADGMAFWYAREPMKTGTIMGYTDRFDGLGVLFDTYDNNMDGDNPAIIAIRGNGKKVKYDIDNDFKENQLGRCRADIRNPSGEKVSVRITYQNRALGVFVDTSNSGIFTKCFEVNDISLPTGYYFGLTAATGGLADNHDVLNFIAYDLDHTEEKTEDQPQGHNRGWYDPYEEFQKYLDKQKKEEELLKQKTEGEVQAPHNTVAEELAKQKGTNQPFEDDHQFFDNLKEKMKHVDEEPATPAPNSKEQPAVQHHEGGSVTFNMQTGLLILEALEEVARTIKKSSTKSDIINVSRECLLLTLLDFGICQRSFQEARRSSTKIHRIQ